MTPENPNFNEPQTDWHPPAPNNAAQEPPQMSEAATLGGIFFEPGKTFEDLRRKPRFLLASLLIIVVSSIFLIGIFEKVGFERIALERMNKSPMTEQMSPQDKQKSIEMQTKPFVKYLTYASFPVVSILSILLGSLLYWLGANAMGGTMTFLRGISVWVYASLPPTLLHSLANILVLFLKSSEDIEVAQTQKGLVQASPAYFLDGNSVAGALLGTFDLFFIWGWILAAIGLHITGKISKSAAWAVVLFVALFNIAFRVIGAMFS